MWTPEAECRACSGVTAGPPRLSVRFSGTQPLSPRGRPLGVMGT